ncbi:MAG: hypothetical protein WDW38_010448 [Sanguina aurantia]
MQLRGGELKETVQPNLAWAPVKVCPRSPPTMGSIMAVPPPSHGIASLTEVVLPRKGTNVFIAPGANVMGDVRIGDNSSIWYNAVLRGDVNSIEIGKNTNIQDNAIVHVARHNISGTPCKTVIGNNVTVGHGATVHGASVGDSSLIGMGAILLDGVIVEAGAVVAAGAVVIPGSVVLSGQVWAGNPAKYLRPLSKEEQKFISDSAESYSQLADEHRFENSKTFEELLVEDRIMKDRAELALPLNSLNQMWVYDAQTCIATRPKK